jgi:RNA polymerase sigma-70 factor, ECF subfamily
VPARRPSWLGAFKFASYKAIVILGSRLHEISIANSWRSTLASPRVDARGQSVGMDVDNLQEVKAGLAPNLARLWRYGVVLSGSRDTADDLVQATCLRAIERADQFQLGTHLDRWLFSILRSIWLNELRSRRVREGRGFVDASEALVFDGGRETETNIFAAQVLREVGKLPEAQRETVLLVYVEALSYREAADILAVPIGTVMSRLAAARLTLGRLQAARDP